MTNSRSTATDSGSFSGQLAHLVYVTPSVFAGVFNVNSELTDRHVGHVMDTDAGYVAYRSEGDIGDWELDTFESFNDAVLAILPYAPVL